MFSTKSSIYSSRIKFPEISSGVELPKNCESLLKSMLEKDPLKRINIENILEHPYLKTSFSITPKSVDDLDQYKKESPSGICSDKNALGKIFVKKFVDLKISKKEREI